MMPVRLTSVWLLVGGLAGLAATTPGLAATAENIPPVFFTGARDEVMQSATYSDNASVPWLERLQMRLGRDNSDQEKQSYAARLRIKTPSQVRAEQDILKLRTHRGSTDNRVALSQELRRRYRLLIELQQQQQYTHLLKQQQQLANKVVAAIRSLVSSDQFRPKSLQGAELRLTTLSEQRRLATRRLRQARRRVAELLPGTSPTTGDADFDLAEPVPISALIGLLTTASDASEQSHSAALGLALLDADIARQRLRRERGRSGFGLRFMELRYERESGDTDDVYRLAVGIDLPTSGSTFAASERQIQYSEAEYQVHRLHRQQARERDQAKGELDLLMAEYQLLQNRRADLGARLERYQAHGENSIPVVLTLDLKREQLDYRQRQIDIEADIYRRYIDTLHLQDRLATEPLRNWLANSLPIL